MIYKHLGKEKDLSHRQWWEIRNKSRIAAGPPVKPLSDPKHCKQLSRKTQKRGLTDLKSLTRNEF